MDLMIDQWRLAALLAILASQIPVALQPSLAAPRTQLGRLSLSRPLVVSLASAPRLEMRLVTVKVVPL